jgi:hypothetical protein
MAAPANDALFAIVGAGPSLDYSRAAIERLQNAGAHFLISDSVAAAFLRLYPKINATVFTVELRRHLYLARIGGMSSFTVMAYEKASGLNLRFTKKRTVTRFRLRGEPGDLPELYSPGTVLGVMLSHAVNILDSRGEIHILGADFSYIDNQIYARLIDPHVPAMHRLQTRETWQYEMALKKTGGILMKAGMAVRTSFELMQSRENMRDWFAALPAGIRLVEYSPIGLDTGRVEKRLP